MLFKMAVRQLQMAMRSVTWLVTAMGARPVEDPTGCLCTLQPLRLAAALLLRLDGHLRDATPTLSRRVL